MQFASVPVPSHLVLVLFLSSRNHRMQFLSVRLGDRYLSLLLVSKGKSKLNNSFLTLTVLPG